MLAKLWVFELLILAWSRSWPNSTNLLQRGTWGIGVALFLAVDVVVVLVIDVAAAVGFHVVVDVAPCADVVVLVIEVVADDDHVADAESYFSANTFSHQC